MGKAISDNEISHFVPIDISDLCVLSWIKESTGALLTEALAVTSNRRTLRRNFFAAFFDC
jgi:hypothetical protein